ncbi:MAG: hypothetical protein Fur0020_01310 [Thermodesulfovibrionia bacterium]
MRLKHHLSISAGVSGIVYYLSRSWELTTTSFLAGVFIDLDHVIDYFLHEGVRLDIKDFFRFYKEERYKRLTIMFHGWEWLILLLLLSWISDWNPVLTGVLIGFTQHLLLDKFYNVSRFGSYSFFWRWRRGFEPKLICLEIRKGWRPLHDSNVRHQV